MSTVTLILVLCLAGQAGVSTEACHRVETDIRVGYLQCWLHGPVLAAAWLERQPAWNGYVPAAWVCLPGDPT